MRFDQALQAVWAGSKITRSGWNGPGQFVQVQNPTPHSKMTQPYLYLEKPDQSKVPWVPSQGDLFAHDWLAYS